MLFVRIWIIWNSCWVEMMWWVFFSFENMKLMCCFSVTRSLALSLSHSFSWKFSVFLNQCLFISLSCCLFALLSLPISKRVNFQLHRPNIAVEFSLFVNLDMWFCYWCFAGRRCYRIVSSEWYSCWWPSAGKYKF